MTTTKPVKILLVGLNMTPELQALVDEGHTVTVALKDDGIDTVLPGEWDLIMGPKCWRITQDHMKFLPLALKEARAAMPKLTRKKEKG